LEPNININTDTMVYMDAAVVAEVIYLIQNDMVTLVNNAFLAYATGDELSNLWADRGITRLSATIAVWLATFWRGTKSPTNYDIPAWTIISTQPAGANGTIISYITTSDVTLYWTVGTPWVISYTTQTTWWLIGDWTYSYKITALAWDNIETDAWPNLDVVISNGLNSNTISLTWVAMPNAIAYNVYIFNGSDYVLLHQVTSPSYVDTAGTSVNIQTPPATNETGNLEITTNIEAVLGWAFWNVAPNTITQFVTKPVGLEYVFNALETAWGSDDEDDDTYRARIAEELQLNTGKVTVTGYQQTCEAVPWVWTATVTIPIGWQYRNNIEIIITASDWSGVPTQTLIDTVQDVVTRDENRAVCDNITVRWPDTSDIDYTIDIISYDHGYSQAHLISAIQDSIGVYFRSIPVGSIVYVVWISNAVHDTLWIIDFTVTIPAANIQLAPSYMAVQGTATINFL
jgi:uncharacterized phage protein gp47/JayE